MWTRSTTFNWAKRCFDTFERFALATIGQSTFGKLEYWIGLRTFDYLGGPLNGSQTRQITLSQLFKSWAPTAILETGTFRGQSTEFLASKGIPVHSIELSSRYHAFAKERLRRYENVVLSLGDSRRVLLKLSKSGRIPSSRVFFYLDAHWHQDLPLLEEVAIIFRHWSDAIIMIDDFQVPYDAGYVYDNYGNGKALTVDYLKPLEALHLSFFFPTLPASKDTGQRRGWVILARDEQPLAELHKLDTIQEWRSLKG